MPKRLYIAEKPSLARAIAKALPQPITNHNKKGVGYIEAANGDKITWLFGHMLELAPPDSYDPALKSWSFDPLPFIPTTWQYLCAKDKKAQINLIGRLLKENVTVVHAGDPDREGQLLVDELLLYLGCQRSVERILINDVNVQPVQQAITKIQPNQAFVSLYHAGLGRQRADWLYGMNMSRAYTLFGQANGYQGVLPVGRVQTPVLGLVVQRDLEIEAFTAVPYFDLWAKLKTASQAVYFAKWQPSQRYARQCDDQGRLLEQTTAQTFADQSVNCPADVTDVSAKVIKKNAPPPYTITTLGIEANKSLSFSAEKTLKLAQSLYESGIITYPRSDCEYIPDEHHAEAKGILGAIALFSSELAPFVGVADFSQKGRYWNTKKVNESSHHAIIPTTALRPNTTLGGDESALLSLIAKRYIGLFLAPYQYESKSITLCINHETFIAKGQTILDLGWRALYQTNQTKTEGEEEDQGDKQQLPAARMGEQHHVLDLAVRSLKTKPPAYFTEATLLEAMQKIARYVTNENIKAKLKETSGIGTSATRASIIAALFRRQLLSRQKKQIRSTETGRKLISILPDIARTPDMTAFWEMSLDGIVEGSVSLEPFLAQLGRQLTQLIAIVKKTKSVDFTSANANKPSVKMVNFCKLMASRLSIDLPKGIASDRAICKTFIETHDAAFKKAPAPDPNGPPSDKQRAYATKLAATLPADQIPKELFESRSVCSKFISKHAKKTKGKAGQWRKKRSTR